MTEEEKSGSELLDELFSLGQQLSTAVRGLWDSEDSRKLREEMEAGFLELGHQVEGAVKSAQESEAAQQLGVQVRETMEKARESDVASRLEEGLVQGLRELNEQVSKMVSPLESQPPEADETDAPEETPGETKAEPEA
ncbi:hypothetical protein ACFLWA_05790 [Chloroflexota bacterium]